ncbi:metal-dependent hydrolase [Oligoflexus tunisiensis]|uniref:metal-dependent hydrolase n=1 Tax=Oligoflexus tunisiensis TaxID=708132 RepID=UPI00114CC62E|nr:metal-dependent hydrolase [Oligoflexus tunisiensis]
MDPIAHTLAGATLAQTGLKRLTPLATATLIIGANLPDIDGVMSFFGSDTALEHRRGVTHGILAQALFPFLLCAGILAYDRFIRRRRDPARQPVRPGLILLLAFIGVLSHPYLDWLNTYGVRLLMPFHGRWFYGDTLFIIDAWMWLLMGASAVFAWSPTRWSQWLWLILGLGASTLVTATALVPLPAKFLWWIGIAGIVIVRRRGISPTRNRKVALGCLAAFGIYLGLMKVGNRRIQDKAQDWVLAHYGETLTDIMTGPLPANPFHREVVAVTATHYYGLRVPVLDHDAIVERYEPVPRPQPDPIIQLARAQPEIRGFINWARYPVYEIQEAASGYRVIIRDLRYVRPDQDRAEGIGLVETFINRGEL